ncbi:MAG: hypothetical protein R3Y58_06970 [Eubacteriales bacterium]
MFGEKIDGIKKTLTKKKIENFWRYYKAIVVMIVFVGVFIANTVLQMNSQTETALYALFINAQSEDVNNSEFKEKIIESLEIDTSLYNLIIDSSFFIDYDEPDANQTDNQQKLVILISTQQLDVVAMDITTYKNMYYNDFFLDLNECFSEEELSNYVGEICYADNLKIQQYDDTEEKAQFIEDTIDIDPKIAEDMEEPIPIGLYVDEDSTLRKYFEFEGEVVVSIISNSNHIEDAKSFVEFCAQN